MRFTLKLKLALAFGFVILMSAIMGAVSVAKWSLNSRLSGPACPA